MFQPGQLNKDPYPISSARSEWPPQVQQLKQRRDKEGADALDADQRKKIAGEGDLLADIAALGGILEDTS